MTYEIFSWRMRHWAFVVAGLVTFATIIVWWMAVWYRSVVWTPRRVIGSILAGGVGVIAGMILGAMVAAATREEEVGIFIGGTTAIVLWMIAVCILWRASPLELARQQDQAVSGTTEVRCPRCQYIMTGLREARCPECGEIYTLDALFTAQRADETPLG